MTMGRTGMFHTLTEFLEDIEGMRFDDNVKSKSINNLTSLRCEFAKYFLDTTRDDLAFIRNSYLVTDVYLVSMFNEVDNTQEKFKTLKKDSNIEDAYKEKTLYAYWSAMVSSYPTVASATI